jgi:hypothetical protein
MGILDGNVIPFIEEPHVLMDESYLIYGHTLKKGPNDSLIFFSLGYANEIPLPNAGYHKRWPTGIMFLVYLAG